MKPQYEFFKHAPSKNDTYVRTKTGTVLPSGAGYGPEQFSNDIINAFKDSERADVDHVKNTWEDHVLYTGNKYGQRFVSLTEARGAVKAMDGFLDKMKESPLTKALMNYHNGDAEAAAQTFMDWIEYRVDTKMDMPGLVNAMDKALDSVENDPEIQNMAIGTGVGEKGQSFLTPQSLRIKELLNKVRKKYDFAGVRSFNYEKSMFPEDSINVKNMESYGEVMRIPKPLLGAEDDEFYMKMATKNFPVLEYEKAIPMPRKFVILVDISGSMQHGVDGVTKELTKGYLRSEYAQATAIALAEQAELGGNSCEVIYFDGDAHPPVTGTPTQIKEQLLAKQFRGGDTNFEAAFRAADKTDADSVVLVTDGGSRYTKPPKAPMMTLIMGGDGDVNSHCPQLKTDSYKYELVQ